MGPKSKEGGSKGPIKRKKGGKEKGVVSEGHVGVKKSDKKKVAGNEGHRRTSVISIPQGTHTQQRAAMKLFGEFLSASNLTWERVSELARSTALALQSGVELPVDSLYSLLETWVMFLFNYESGRSRNKHGFLSLGTADNYLSQVKQYLLERYGTLDERRCRSTRNQLKKIFSERAQQLHIVQTQAPPATVNDMKILVSMLFKKGDVDSLQFASLLSFQWHMLGRSVDSCWLLKSQLAVMSEGELFVTFTRLKTSTLQGVSMYNHRSDWMLCPIHALAVAIITDPMPSALVFNMFSQNEIAPALMVNTTTSRVGAVSQLEASAAGVVDDEAENENLYINASSNVRKRPSAAQFINFRLRALEQQYMDNPEAVARSLGFVPLTAGLQSHSMRRGAAQWVSACYKIAVQWLCSRGMWMMDSLSKAFAYIGTTLKEDQKVAKRLSDWDPDDAAFTPSVATLTQHFEPDTQAALARLQDRLFFNVHGFTGESSKCNISRSVENLLFVTTIMNYTSSSTQFPESSIRLAILRACATVDCPEEVVLRASSVLVQRHTAESNMPHNCTNCNVQAALGLLVARVEGLSAKIDRFVASTGQAPAPTAAPTPTSNSTEALDTHEQSSTIAGFVYTWYTQRRWDKPFVGKKAQSELSDMCSRLSILKLTHGLPIYVKVQPPVSDANYNSWRSDIFALSHALAQSFNERMGKIDGKKVTVKASTVRRRFQQAATLGGFSDLISTANPIVDEVTPAQHQKERQLLRKFQSRTT